MRKLKWFTLVEILIVIVIIGILIWALVPRMQSAQWRARDVARKNDLSQIQSAVVTSYSDKWTWPAVATTGCTGWCSVLEIENQLIWAWLNWVPTDPIKWNNVELWSRSGTNYITWYWYMISMKNWVKDAWFMLIAHTEVEWWSNWVFCSGASTLASGYVGVNTDLRNVVPCTSVSKWSSSTDCEVKTWGACKYGDTTELRYILVY